MRLDQILFNKFFLMLKNYCQNILNKFLLNLQKKQISLFEHNEKKLLEDIDFHKRTLDELRKAMVIGVVMLFTLTSTD
mgnify:CR=1 FL=1